MLLWRTYHPEKLLQSPGEGTSIFVVIYLLILAYHEQYTEEYKHTFITVVHSEMEPLDHIEILPSIIKELS